MSELLDRLRVLIQVDVNNRGLARDPNENLLTACPGDLAAACHSIAAQPGAAVVVVTGFFIPHAIPPAAETDGPLGAVWLARALTPLGIRVAIVVPPPAKTAVQAGVRTCGLEKKVLVLSYPPRTHPWETWLQIDWRQVLCDSFQPTHLVALEHVGPSHTPESVQAQLSGESWGSTCHTFLDTVPKEHWDRCHNMRGVDITEYTPPAHLLFEFAQSECPAITTIGIGDGGNEIGMGKIRWDVIRRNIPNGGLIACRVPTQHLIVCGVSNWGAYALGQGVRLLRGAAMDSCLFDLATEEQVLRAMVENGPLVDGVTGKPTVTVDGLDFASYSAPLREMGRLT